LIVSTVSYTEAKEEFEALWDRAISTREPIVVTRPGSEDIAIIAAEELAGYIETAHLLSSPENARRLLDALERTNRGEGLPITSDELKRKFKINGVDR
jgi:antitoxin YefM